MTIELELTRLARVDAPRVLSMLASRFGDLDIADDAVQEALIAATRTWPRDGVPDNPAAWLMTAARRRAIDAARAVQRERNVVRQSGPELVDDGLGDDASDRSEMIDDDTMGDASFDERLRLLLLCCHPSLDNATQVALTLRLVGGLTTAEIATAFVVAEPTVAQRIVRAKRKIRTAAIPMTVPADPAERLSVVMSVLYLVFNEGYLSRSDAAEPLRVDLMDESIRLTEVLADLTPEHAEPRGLLALERFQRARVVTRFDGAGNLVLLADQDRSQWDREEIARANATLRTAMTMMQPGPYQVEAVIAAEHANAHTAADTDWTKIAALYGQLDAMVPSPVVRLNRAVAVAEADGPPAGLALLDDPELAEQLDRYHLYWATLGELRHRNGEGDAARAAWRRGIDLLDPGPERRLLEKRMSPPVV